MPCWGAGTDLAHGSAEASSVLANEAQDTCPLCSEKFELFRNAQDELMCKNATILEGGNTIVHLHCYQNLSWSEARQNIKHLRKHNETLADLYEHRLNQPEPGPDWDGVDRKTSK